MTVLTHVLADLVRSGSTNPDVVPNGAGEHDIAVATEFCA